MNSLKKWRQLVVPILTILLSCTTSWAQTSDSITTTFNQLFADCKLVEELTEADFTELPVGIDGVKSNLGFSLVITEAELHNDHAMINAVARLTLPLLDDNNKSTELYFGAEKVKLSFTGGLVGNFKLVLLQGKDIPILNKKATLRLEGGFNKNTGAFDPLSPYALFDCNGFKEFGLNASLLFKRDLVIPINDNGEPLPSPQQLKTTLHTVIGGWDDLLVFINLPPFAAAQLPDVGFRCEGALIDLSVEKNSPQMRFPDRYIHQDPVPEMWRGVYIKLVEVICPPEFQLKDSPDRLSFSSTHLLLDRTGITGGFRVNNLLGLSEGSASGWDFSIDQLHIGLVQSHVVEGGFAGKIGLPVLEDGQYVEYSALIDDSLNYAVCVSTTKNLEIDAFCADVKLFSNSTISLIKKDKQLHPEAHLFGEMSLQNEKIDFPGLSFQNLSLSTKAPRFGIEGLGTIEGKPLTCGLIPISLSELKASVANGKARLGFGANLALMKEKISGNTSILLEASYTETHGRTQWKYEKTSLSEIVLKAEFGACTLDGRLAFFDPTTNIGQTYGKGFAGQIGLTVLDEIGVTARGIFGKKDRRYFFTDVMATGLNAPLFAGITLDGIGGGVFNNMQRTACQPGASKAMSGINYVPIDEDNFGIKFNTMLYFGSKNTALADVCLEMLFNENWGIDNIAFYGNAEICPEQGTSPAERLNNTMCQTVKVPEINETTKDNTNLIDKALAKFPTKVSDLNADIKANFLMEYDVPNKLFTGNAMAYFTAGNIIKGSGSQGEAGNINFYFAEDKWYIHAGNPSNRMGLDIKLGPVNANANAYFMLGHDIPPFPDPPENVTHYLSSHTSYSSAFNDSELSLGQGMALGAGLNINTGKKTFLMLYGQFDAALGFDVMMKDMHAFRCNNQPVGLNGWYAQGQAYAYLYGDLGINLDLFKKEKKVVIAEGAAGMIMDAGLPNPTWFRGYMAGHYNLLNGLVKGEYDFEMELGEPCDLNFVGSPVADLKVIAHSRPMNKETEVDVFANPQVAFNMKYDRPFELYDEASQQKKQYRIHLEEFSLSQLSGELVPGSWVTDPEQKTIAYQSTETLEGHTDYVLYTKVQFQEKENGQWFDMEEESEEQSVEFTTGPRPNHIQYNNISYTYPVIDQQYYLQGESNMGIIQLKGDQGYLFEDNFRSEVHFISATDHQIVSCSYNLSKKQINFSVPTLQNTETYTMLITVTPPEVEMNDNLEENYKAIEMESTTNNSTEIRERKVKELINLGKGSKQLLQYQFSTSRYNTLKQKLADYIPRECGIFYPQNHLFSFWLLGVASYQESFGFVDLKGSPFTNNHPLIKAEAPMNESFYLNKINPIIYREYPLDGKLSITNRNAYTYGIPPTKALRLSSNYQMNTPNTNNKLPYVYEVLTTTNDDYTDFQTQALSVYTNDPNPPAHIKHLRGYAFPGIEYIDYHVQLQYYRPDGLKGSHGTIHYNYR